MLPLSRLDGLCFGEGRFNHCVIASPAEPAGQRAGTLRDSVPDSVVNDEPLTTVLEAVLEA